MLRITLAITVVVSSDVVSTCLRISLFRLIPGTCPPP